MAMYRAKECQGLCHFEIKEPSSVSLPVLPILYDENGAQMIFLPKVKITTEITWASGQMEDEYGQKLG